MKKVLIIDERFPSTGGSRTEKFVKFLPKFGWEPLILTIGQKGRNDYAEEILQNNDADIILMGRELLRNPFFPTITASRNNVETFKTIYPYSRIFKE